MTDFFHLTEPSQTHTSGHTPGKWEARELFADDEPAQSMGLFIYTEQNARGHRDPIASLPGIGREDFANAQLIAAAPELLAALEFIAADLNTEMPAETAAIVQRAIAKARGQNA